MSRHTPRARTRIDDLAAELAIGAAIRLRTDSDEIRPIVDAVVAYLVEEYPSQDLYIPSSVTYPVGEMRAAMDDGRSVRWICREFRVSRKTLYRLLDDEQTGGAV